MTTSQIIVPRHLELHKSFFHPPRGPNDIYTLIYDCGSGERFHTLVHVPLELRPALLAGKPARLQLIRLAQNGDAMRALPDQPEYLVSAVVLESGAIATAIPPELLKVRRRLQKSAAIAATAALAGALVSAWSLSGLLFAVWRWRNARNVPSLSWTEAIKDSLFKQPSRHAI